MQYPNETLPIITYIVENTSDTPPQTHALDNPNPTPNLSHYMSKMTLKRKNESMEEQLLVKRIKGREDVNSENEGEKGRTTVKEKVNHNIRVIIAKNCKKKKN